MKKISALLVILISLITGLGTLASHKAHAATQCGTMRVTEVKRVLDDQTFSPNAVPITTALMITLENNTSCMSTTQRTNHSVLIYPENIDNNSSQYRSYVAGKVFNENSKKLEPIFLDSSADTRYQRNGRYIIKICRENDLTCNNDQTIVGVSSITISSPVTPTLAFPTLTPAPPTPTPLGFKPVRVDRFPPQQCVYVLGEEIPLTLTNVVPNSDYVWWWRGDDPDQNSNLKHFRSEDIDAMPFTISDSEVIAEFRKVRSHAVCFSKSRSTGRYKFPANKACNPGNDNYAEIRIVSDEPPSRLCSSPTPTQPAYAGPTTSPTTTPPLPLPPCKEWRDHDNKKIEPTPKNTQEAKDKNAQCAVFSTGLGIDISTDPVGFIKSIFSILLSISGGIALILIIYSGYQIMISQGNAEKVEGAKETLTSAIVGLLFIIFSLVLLQTIGVDILRIPGFAP